MEDQPEINTHTDEVHQQVREFVQAYITEHDLPLIVMTIEGTSKTRYAATLATKNDLIPKFILAEVRDEFHVEAFSLRGDRSMRFDVYVWDGRLRMANHPIVTNYY